MNRTAKPKEQAAPDFLEMIRESWTYDRMTPEEQERIERLLEQFTDSRFDGHIRGEYFSRWRQMQNIYSAFLAGLGYSGPEEWREEQKKPCA